MIKIKYCVSVMDVEGEDIEEEGMAVVLGLLFPFEITTLSNEVGGWRY